jgi:hypothetical protein
VVEKWGKILGVDRPDAVTAAANLAWTYRAQGRLEEVEKLEHHSTRNVNNKVAS